MAASPDTPGVELDLWPEPLDPHADRQPFVRITPALGPRPTDAVVVIFPGGGYHSVSHDNEGAPVAERLNRAGYAAAVVHYRVSPNRHPAPLHDAARALRLVKHHADRFGFDGRRVALLGFSAGGHLASTLAVASGVGGDPPALDDLAAVDVGVQRLALVYPVVYLEGRLGHGGSGMGLLGEAPDAEFLRRLNPMPYLTRAAPPAWLLHAADDEPVPAAGSVRFAERCLELGVPVELHVYPAGGHGFGTQRALGPLARWHETLVAWLDGWARGEGEPSEAGPS